MSEVLEKTSCPVCPSSDAFVLYDDGHGYCFSCQHWEGSVDYTPSSISTKKSKDLIPLGDIKPLSARGITAKTCDKYKYFCTRYEGRPVQVANYTNDQGQVVAQKVRTPDKDFFVLGSLSEAGLYGQHLYRTGGKLLVITEGEIDALSVSQSLNNTYPVVSVPTGAAGAKKAIQKTLQWIETYNTVVFCFDMDEPGREAASECALLLTPGKAKIASLPLKDPNEMIKEDRSSELRTAIFEAKEYRPDGIVEASELFDKVSNPKSMQGIPYPWNGLNQMTLGLRPQELVTLTAGSGQGKSSLCREIAYSLIMQGERVGYIALEESTERSILGILGVHMNQRLHLGIEDINKEEFKKAYEEVFTRNMVYLYDHWGSTDSDNLLAKIRYLARGCDCKWIFLDHLSIVVSGIGDGDERRLIDNTMTALRSLVQELGIGMILVSHLRDPEGKKGHEEGAKVSLRQLRGSRSIGQLSDMVIALERDQQGKDPNLTQVRVLKNRLLGTTGIAGVLHYNPETGRMTEHCGDISFSSEDEEEDY